MRLRRRALASYATGLARLLGHTLARGASTGAGTVVGEVGGD
jgi:hypothetical protein